MPIGNGQAPGTEIGRGAAGAGARPETGATAGAGRAAGGFTGNGFAGLVGIEVFFAAIVFVGFLAALRAAGLTPAALFFFAASAVLLAAFVTRFLTAVFFAGRFDFTRDADFSGTARFLARALRVSFFLLPRFAGARLSRRAAFFAADFFFAAIRSPLSVKRGIANELRAQLTAAPRALDSPNPDTVL